MFNTERHGDLIDDPQADAIPFGIYRQEIWDAVRSMYLEKDGPWETQKYQAER